MVPPLGVAYLAAYLLKQGHEVMIVDLALGDDFKKEISTALASFQPQIIGISIRNVDSGTYPGNLFFYLPVRNVILYVKEIVDPKVPIILGGAGFSIFAEEILRDVDHDIGIFGEGEHAFAEVVKKIENGEDPRKLDRGVCFTDGSGEYHQTPPWRIDDFDDLPFPARELLDNENYELYSHRGEGKIIWGNIQTKRGCPWNCIYCSYKYLEGQPVRYRSPKKIAEELDFMSNNLGIKNIFIVDSVFNLNHAHLKEMCQEIVKKRIDFKWGTNYSPKGEFIDLLPLMKESGASHLAMGIESLSSTVLNSMQREMVVDEAIRTCERCTELGIDQFLHVMFGGPQETLQTVHSTFDLLETLKPYGGDWQGEGDVLISVGLRIYPHTKLQSIAEKEGVIPIGLNLLKPRFYVSPTISETQLYQAVREYCKGHPRWICPGLGLNNLADFLPLVAKQFSIYAK
jgi:radical SAM superfamily enzyme YgiQ (UPF0313 family)